MSKALIEQHKKHMSALMRLARQRAIASGATGQDRLRGDRFLSAEEMQEFRNLVRQIKDQAANL